MDVKFVKNKNLGVKFAKEKKKLGIKRAIMLGVK